MAVGLRPGGYDQAVHGNRWHALLYTLMRDGDVSPGRMYELVHQIAEGGETTQFSNDFLAAYAIELNARLAGESEERALARGHEALRHAQGQT